MKIISSIPVYRSIVHCFRLINGYIILKEISVLHIINYMAILIDIDFRGISMFNKLKKCKTLKEIYQTLGRDFFEKVASVILIMWCMIPVIMLTLHFINYDKDNFWFRVRYNMDSDYQMLVTILGIITLEFILIYAIGLFVLRGKSIGRRVRDFIKNEPWNLFFAILILWSVVCTLKSSDVQTSFLGSTYRYEGLKAYFYYAAIYSCAHIIRDDKARKCIMNTYAGVSVLLGICLVFQNNNLFGFDRIFAYGGATVFCQFNHMGYYLNMSVMIMAGLFIASEKMISKIVYALGMAFQLYCLLLNNTFGAYLGAMTGLLILSVIYIIRTKSVKKMIIPVLIFVTVSGLSMSGRIRTISGENLTKNFEVLAHDTQLIAQNADDADRAGTGRMGMWKAGLKMVPESPVFGYGPEMINKEYFAKYMNYTERVENEYLQYMIFLGIPGLLLYLTAFATMIVCQLKNINKLGLITIASAGCVAGYLVGAFVGNSMYYTAPYMYMFLGLATKRDC